MRHNNKKIEIPEDWLREQYVQYGKTLLEIAREWGCSQTAIRNSINNYGIQRRKTKVELNLEDVREVRINGATLPEMAIHFRCSVPSIRKHLIQCGLLKINHELKPKENLIGKRFGMLEIIGLHGRTQYEEYLWDCVCDCGNNYTANQEYLFRNLIQSCGCRKRGGFDRVVSGKGFISNRHFRKLQESNRLNRGKRKIKFEITIEELEALPHDNCKYCGDALIFPKCVLDFKRGIFNASLDRIDSTIDIYNKENCQWICKMCNLMKLDWSEDEFVLRIQKMSFNLRKLELQQSRDMMSGL